LKLLTNHQSKTIVSGKCNGDKALMKGSPR